MTNILLFLHQQNQHSLSATQINDDYIETSNINQYVDEHQVVCSFDGTEPWVVRSDTARAIKRKVEVQGKPLEKWNVQVYRGILTGYDKAFFIDSATRQGILDNCRTDKECKLTNEIIRPMLRGKDIRKFGNDWTDLWMINTHNGVRGKLKRIDVDNIPSIKQHLDNFWRKLSARTDQGDTPYNLRNCAYIKAFDEPKIIYPETTKFLPFYLDEKGFLTTKT
jgi:hypothetical protein